VEVARSRRTWLVCGAVVVATLLIPLGTRVGAKYDHDDTLWANAMRSASGWQRSYDFAIFLSAANDVLAGRDPYPKGDELDRELGSPYAYPPVLAVVVTPLAALPERTASTFVPGVLWTLLLVAATVGALLVLDVRDWRCYPVALLYPVTLEAIEYGAIGPLLLFLLALLWRYRDRLWAGAGAAGAAVVLKLFLWPVLVWLAITGRARAAVTATLGAIGLALVSWVAIGFAGLGDYPHLLRRLSDVEADNSYSAYAVLRALDVPSGLAQGIVVAGGIALLVLAFRAARDLTRGPVDRDRRSLTLALAAALVMTPILWLHYLVLLLLPIALARPRLSALWFVPLAMTVFEALDWYRGWPRGDGKALASVAILIALVVVWSLRPRREPSDGAQLAPSGA
jgi:alpha-1,2-mannosyltransferase